MAEELTDEQRERYRLSRAKIAEAIAEYADVFPVTEGALVSGYVCVFELSNLDNEHWLMWFTGNGGEPTKDSLSGLAAWRVEGMLRRAIRDIIVHYTDTE